MSLARSLNEGQKVEFTTVELDETGKPLSGDLIVRSLGNDSRKVHAVMDRKTLLCWDNKVPYLAVPISGCFVETSEDRQSLSELDIALVSAFGMFYFCVFFCLSYFPTHHMLRLISIQKNRRVIFSRHPQRHLVMYG